MRPLAGDPLRRARSGRRLAGAKLKYTDMNSKYALPKDGGLIVDSAPSDIIRRYEKIPASVFEHESEGVGYVDDRSEEHTSELQSLTNIVCRLLLEKKKQPAYFSVIDSKFKGDVDKFVDYLFDKSIYGSEKNFNAFKEHPSVKTLREDPMILFAQSVKDEKKALDKALADFDAGYAIAHRAYVKGLLAMYGDLASFPDANSTLRLTYGQVKGYSPRDCDYYGHQTTLDGVMEKEDSTNWEFVVSARLKELYQAGDFGPYKMPNGKMPVAFCATTHTTGGNSGSPVLNGQGELIGINFDRNWEGVGGDIQYLPDYQRSIIVDIRYVLFVIDKYAGAGYLLNEMEFSR